MGGAAQPSVSGPWGGAAIAGPPGRLAPRPPGRGPWKAERSEGAGTAKEVLIIDFLGFNWDFLFY